eukprot:CAMPEP_0172318440 /NCGR_PEP_ID=MMETSP1058-20130122/34889_1 /TAXON_ID=83371 /ORGANISM="Detonula confervacea, Strain CCMP 353" /LENGTH=177 /DNA_ID=CAMNT_0013033279 /DNA_START=1 /DNA_END=534 /DNA_ORIENTATION=-
MAFLKLLNDVSSIESTYNSNHTLKTLSLSPHSNNAPLWEMQHHIMSAIQINVGFSNAPHREKTRRTQLNSSTRMKLCRLQGIDYSYNNIFADIDPTLLPDVLALVGEKHGQSELYSALVATAPDLTSLINRKAMLENTLAVKRAHVAALTAEYSKHTAPLLLSSSANPLILQLNVLS